MSFVLQIQEIVEGPIKDLYIEAGSSLPTFAPNFVPEEVDFSQGQFSSEWLNGQTFSSDWGSEGLSSEWFNGQTFSSEWGSDQLVTLGNLNLAGGE
ncbi:MULTISPECIES: hypothetical protein [Corynebacterium]|uniref:hypothetical protein n=1 Tax=Corynebacterium TaxID=1716 RepID=UPI00124D2DA4|nr:MULTISPECIES: hypothetical protein [Corynebacterium]